MRRTTMKMMTVAVLTAILLLAQGCEQPVIPSPSGSGIRFKTSTSWGSDVATKTVYGEVVTDGGLKKQRIDWLVDDHIRIYSDKASFAYDASVHYADYTVERVYSENSHPEISYATIQPSGLLDGTTSASSQANGLVWGEGLHKFVSVYPSPYDITSEYAGETFALTGGDDASSSISRTFAASLPASQEWTKADVDANRVIKPNMDFAYMYAMAAASAGSEVTLSFKPMFTAFQFTIDSGDDAFMWLKKFTLKSNGGALAGKFSATMTVPNSGSGSIAYSYVADDVTDEIELTFLEEAGSTNGIKVVKESPVTFTVFALPVDYNDGMSITVESDDVDGSNQRKTLALKKSTGDEWVKFEKCRKYNITLGVPGEWEYVIDDPADITLTYEGGTENLNGAFNSYRRRLDGSQKEKVAYKLQYSTDNGTTWTDGLPVWLTSSSTSGYTGSYESDDVLSLTMAAQTNSAETNTHTDYLQSHSVTGVKDLSTVNVATGATVSRTTANCYVVQASGTYKFPLVYGNGVVGGMVNASAYTGAGSGTNFLDTFLNTNDAKITSPYILTDLGLAASDVKAELVWTDVRDMVTVTGEIEGTGENAYINFEIPQATIHQGNAVIALKKSDGTILWSWHIWVTDHVLNNPSQIGDYSVAPYNVGWVDGEFFEKYDARECLVRAIQTPAGGATGATSEVATITQTEKLDYVMDNNPYFQWGRKDPLQATTGIALDSILDGSTWKYIRERKPLFKANGDTLSSSSMSWSTIWQAGSAVSIGQSIRNPYTIYTVSQDEARYPRWSADLLFNLWNTGYTSGAGDSAPVVKSIYDPSPVGYVVPNMDLFNYLLSLISESGPIEVANFKDRRDEKLYYSQLSYNGMVLQAMSALYGYDTLFGTGVCYWSSTPIESVTGVDAGASRPLYFYYTKNYNTIEWILSYAFRTQKSQPQSSGLSIRPIKEDASLLFGVTTGGQQSGGEYTGGDLNPGWGDGN